MRVFYGLQFRRQTTDFSSAIDCNGTDTSNHLGNGDNFNNPVETAVTPDGEQVWHVAMSIEDLKPMIMKNLEWEPINGSC